MRIKIEIFCSPGCRNCEQAKKVLNKLVTENKDYQVEWRDLNILEELDYAVSLGVLNVPAIAINGKLEFFGMPPVGKLLAILNEKNRPSFEE